MEAFLKQIQPEQQHFLSTQKLPHNVLTHQPQQNERSQCEVKWVWPQTALQTEQQSDVCRIYRSEEDGGKLGNKCTKMHKLYINLFDQCQIVSVGCKNILITTIFRENYW